MRAFFHGSNVLPGTPDSLCHLYVETDHHTLFFLYDLDKQRMPRIMDFKVYPKGFLKMRMGLGGSWNNANAADVRHVIEALKNVLPKV